MRPRLFATLMAAGAALALVVPLYAANAAPDAGSDAGTDAAPDAAPDAVADAGSDAAGVPGAVNAADLLTGFGSKEGCSCVFVDGQTDAYCTQFAQAPGYMSQITIDHAGMSVSAMFFGMTRSAHFTASAGCKLDPL